MVANGVVVPVTELLCEEQAASSSMHNTIIDLSFINVFSSEKSSARTRMESSGV
jgi:hypothetical protein